MKIKFAILFVLLAQLISACGSGSSRFAAINITNSQASPDEKSMSVFSRSDSVYVNFSINNVKKGDEVTGKVIAVNAPGFSPNDLLMGKDTDNAFGKADKDYETGLQSMLWFTYPLDSDGWAIGTYKIEVYFNGNLDTILQFTVR